MFLHYAVKISKHTPIGCQSKIQISLNIFICRNTVIQHLTHTILYEAGENTIQKENVRTNNFTLCIVNEQSITILYVTMQSKQ